MSIKGRLGRVERRQNEEDTAGCQCTYDVVTVGRTQEEAGYQSSGRPTNPNCFYVPDEASVPPPRPCIHCGRQRLQVLLVEADPSVPFAPHRRAWIEPKQSHVGGRS